MQKTDIRPRGSEMSSQIKSSVLRYLSPISNDWKDDEERDQVVVAELSESCCPPHSEHNGNPQGRFA